MSGFVVIAGSQFARPAGPVRIDGRLVRGVSLTSAGGTADLLNGPYRLVNPTSGITGPDGPLDVREGPGRDGGYHVGADTDRAGQSFGVARPTLTVKVDAGSAEETARAVGHLRHLLRGRLWGAAELTFTLAAEARTLTVRHEPAADDFAPMPGGGRVRFVTLRLVGSRPFWRGTPGATPTWGLGTGVGPMLPYLPKRVGTSTVIGQANAVRVGGDQDTYPVLTSTGAWDAATVDLIRNGRTRSYTVTRTLLEGQTLTVRHDPDGQLNRGRQVEGPGGESWAQYLDVAHDLFALRPGLQDVRIVLTNAVGGASAGLTWETLFESALD